MAFEQEYSSTEVYFIASGRTLAAIKSYEQDKENASQLQQQLAQELGAKQFVGCGRHGSFIFDAPTSHPALILDTGRSAKKGQNVYYVPNYETAEGQALQAKIDRIPDMDWTHSVFALRLTGAEETATNPDHLHQTSTNGHYRLGGSARSASFSQYGDTYVVSVPRVVRGIFNAESQAASLRDHYNQAAGYTYEWFTPPDCTIIPYSKVVELREKQSGDQLTARTVMKATPAFPDRKR